MNQVLFHRGPDSHGMTVDGPVGLAMRRLSIIDLQGGDQPIFNEDRSVAVVQNGEIYNYRELRDELRGLGHTFSTDSDTEVFVHLYEQYGVGFVERLRGMFAFALWDSRAQRLLLGRDRFGIKPLYWGRAKDCLLFGSELKSLIANPSFSREIDLESLGAYLTWNWIPTPLTIYRDASKLPAGHVLRWERGTASIERFARPGPDPAVDREHLSFEDEATRLGESLRESVRAHMVADVPVGVLLSGGVDSSALVAMAAEESATRLKTFSVGFDEKSFDELDRARLVARRYGTDHHELVVKPDAAELLPEIVAAFDEPFADSSALPTYLVAGLASEHVKVVLAGEGGDELFAGYFTYVADRLAPIAGPAAARLLPLIERLPSSSGARRLDDKAKRFARGATLGALGGHCAFMQVFSEDAKQDLLRREMQVGSADPLRFHRDRFAETDGAPMLARLQDVDLGISLVDDQLVKTDRTSMAHSLEVRVPLLDAAIAELAFGVPDNYRLRGLAKKRLLRAAVAPLLPKEILAGRKQGFSIPAASWLRGELEPFAREVLSPETLRSQGVFDPGHVTQLFDDHVSRTADHSRHLWSLLMFTLWRASDL